MYNSYFGLAESPFSIAPDPRYLYLSEQHKEALAHLLYGIRNDNGFILLTGEVGTGKTTVCRCLLEQLGPQTDLAFVLNPTYSVLELLAAICDELHVPYPAQDRWLKTYIDALNEHLLRSHALGRHTVLIIDEAQNLSGEVLEQLRLLTNLETNERKLLQIILLGQPELLDILARPELRQLSQRITARFHLGPLGPMEVAAYVQHRLAVAGLEQPLFPPASLKRLYQLSKGIPRVINLLCDRALLGTYTQRGTKVSVATLNQAARELKGEQSKPSSQRLWWLLAALAASVVAALVRFAPPPWLEPNLAQASPPAEPHPLEQPAEPLPQPSPQETLIQAPSLVPDPPVEFDWQWPAALDPALSQAIAYKMLFAAWHLDYKPAEQPVVCQFARAHGLGCFGESGDWQMLSNHNRPAVIGLSEGGVNYAAALLAVEGDWADIAFGDRKAKVPLKDLQRRWDGSYQLLWRQPPEYKEPLKPGSQGLAVAWLEHQLAQIDGRAERPLVDNLYDFTLFRNVKAFQFRQGLAADGVVGPQTSIRLTSLTDGSVPLLVGPGD
ncbi:ExeA family protein [Gallaecimonas xiamenensis]|uniref:Peptidoglycan-binding domain 1 protein n=1 Tax=Gallaecimonas xiamenensis 3-C-1 TaxID=745411 RepID=K2JKW6_9GAMM|nr:ExeA family protein [Gallaecimonas xiamenensis]EKE75963.1 peptidoglycan-binding domain 1 protein [Gallaecimonas xiamenensis 3-C-1]